MDIGDYYAAIGRLATARSAAETATEEALIAVMGEHTRFVVAGADVGVNINRLRKMTNTIYRVQDARAATVPYCIRASVLRRLGELLAELDPLIGRVGRLLHGSPVVDRSDYPAFGDYLVRPAGGRDQSAVKQLRNPTARDYVTLDEVLTLAASIETRAAEVDAIADKIKFREPSVIRHGTTPHAGAKSESENP